MKKRLLALFIIMSQLIFSFSISAQAESKYVDALVGFNIIDSLEKGTFGSEEPLSRADYVRLIAGMINFKYNQNAEKSKYYRDIEKSHKIAEAADYLTDMGYIFGTGKNNFEPDEPINYAEAVTAVVRVLGYGANAEKGGGYPYGYMGIVGSCGVKVSVDDNFAPMSGAKACELIYKALKAEANSIRLDGESKKEKITILSKYHGLQSGKGIVENVKNKSIHAGEKVPQSSITINGEVYDYNKSDANSWLGCGVEFYYDYDNMEIVYLEQDKKCSIIEVNASEIEGIFEDKFEYYSDKEDTRLKKVKISSSADYYYNGKKLITLEDINKFLPKYSGSVRLVDSDGDGSYDFVSIMNYYVFVVKEADLDNGLYYDKYPIKNENEVRVSKPCLDLGPNTDKEVYVTDGKTGISIERNDLTAKLVLLVAESLDGSVVNIITSNAKISGAVSNVSIKDGISYATINGEKHAISESYINSDKRKIEAGTSGEFSITADGIIADMSVKSDYAYLINAYEDDNNDDVVIFKILTEDGNIEKVNSANKLVYNGYGKKEPRDAYELMKNGEEIQSELIMYKTNSKNEIKEIYSVCDGNSDEKGKFYRYLAFKGATSDTDTLVNKSSMNISGRVAFSNDTLMFIVPPNPKTASAAEFDVYPMNEAEHFKKIGSEIYYFKENKDGIVSDVLLKQGAANANFLSSTPLMLVDSVEQAVNDKDELVWKVSGYSDGNYVSYEAEIENYLNAESLKGNKPVRISEGDVVQFCFDGIGRITASRIYFDADKKSYELKANPSRADDFNYACRALYGKVYKRDGSFLKIVFDDLPTAGIELPDSSGEIQSLTSKTSVYEVDLTKRRKIDELKVTDLKDYKTFGPNCDNVFIYQRESAKMIVIYK